MTPAKATADDEPWGVYVHFPWCLKKCPYCDFLSIPVEPDRLLRLGTEPRGTAPPAQSAPRALGASAARELLPHAAYADAVLRELEERTRALALNRAPSTLFFGGGTPSLWHPGQLGRVISALTRSGAAPMPGEVEVTVECNPTSLDEDHARRLLDVGVNRLSLGLQSLDEARLAFLGRLHGAQDGLTAIAAAQRAKVPRISADLIFGVAGQTPEEAASEVRRVAETGITHLSAYALTIEANTQFGTRAARGELPLLDEGLVAESYEAVEETLASLGFEHYEISNYARQGHRARHNLGYWRGDDYLGLGVGAWGTVRLPGGQRLRYRNTASVERYHQIWTGQEPPDPFGSGPQLAQREVIDPNTALRERILLGLRLTEGVDVEEVARELAVPPFPPTRARALARLLERGRLERDGARLRIPKAHWLFADGIIAELL